MTCTLFESDDGSGVKGADGFTFVLQNFSGGINALRNVGLGLRYETISRSVAIEFDTYENALNNSQNLATYQEYVTRGETETASLYVLSYSQTGINAMLVGDVYDGGACGDAFQGDLLLK